MEPTSTGTCAVLHTPFSKRPPALSLQPTGLSFPEPFLSLELLVSEMDFSFLPTFHSTVYIPRTPAF